ncbi:uncharacterized protein LOC117315688 isoform X2 [Pecten maximus]|uniref:uncharacterized protein LOC117315688 isoform X2 n=1 Tax=Pecten maximus TaxID=6579 RepID=UPI001458B8CB|nr:uncharacterized protein LOC117315688 isoform X2 [Pecten maximus]
MQIASTDEATCNSCNDSSFALRLGSCDSNLLVTDRLTSGYWYGQNHSPKPSADPASVKGKCSHGGLRDSGKDTPATGGINKETTDRNLSPHSHLHPQASEAAIKATVEFFIHFTNGILTDIDEDKILNLFGLQMKSRTSLGFAIDVSGSMGNDIAHVKSTLSKRVNQEREGTFAPSKYVLATFNDPESLTTVASTVDGDEMIRWLDALSANGGDDCPEYAISGLMAAIELSELNSVIIVATDADAKDTDNAATAVGAANAKGIKIEFLLTGSCSRRRRYVPLRQKRDLATFQSIAGGTGGTVYRIFSRELPTVLDKLLEESFASSTSVMEYFVQTTSEGPSMNVYVDSEIDSLVITISGPQSLIEASIADPTGTVDIFSTENATRSYSSNSITMTIQNPTPGTWVLTRSAIRQWEVNINVYSDLDIDFQLIETDDSGIYYVSNRNPISGETYTLTVEVYNLNSAASSFAMNILDEDGTVTVTAPINITFLPSITTGYTSIEIPSTNFYVQLSGIDQNGFQFKRMAGTLVKPVAVDLFVQPIFGNLVIGTPRDVTYTLRNLGDTTETYTVIIVDDKGRVLSPSSRHHSVNAGKNITGTFQLSSIVELEYITYTVSVNVHGSSIVLQSTTNTAMVTGPFCSSVMTSPKCNQVIAESSYCSSFTWSATAVFSFDVWKFQVADDVTVTIDGDNSTRLHINGNCCVRNFTVDASPSTGRGCQVSQLVTASTSYQLVVNDDSKVTGPFCSSVMTSPKCNLVIAESSNCSSFTWSATAVFSFDLWVFQVADDVTVTIDGDNSTRLHINGSCCVRNFTVDASPSTGSGCQVSQLVTTTTSYQLVVNADSKVTGPFCSSVMTSPKCNQVIAESSYCSSFTWSATAVFSFDVWKFQVTDDVTVTIDGDNSTRLHINGSCCVRNFTVDASPSTGRGCQVSQLVTASKSYQLVVNADSKVTGPFCSSVMTSPKCNLVIAESSNCSSFTWSATAVFSFDLWVFQVADDVTVTIDGDNSTRLHINGSCCVRNFTVDASPSTGRGCQVSQLVTASKSYQLVVNADSKDDDEARSEDTGTNIGLIVGVLLGVGILVLAVTGLLMYVSRKTDAVKDDGVIEFQDKTHADTSQGTRFDPKLLDPKSLQYHDDVNVISA